jgi:hypothetical protein
MKKIFLLIFLYVFIFNFKADPQFCNLSSPYEWIFDQSRYYLYGCDENLGVAVSVRGEFSFNVSGYGGQDIFIDGKDTKFKNKVNPCNFLGGPQNEIYSFYGVDLDYEQGLYIENFNKYAGSTSNEIRDLSGDIFLGAINFSLEKWFSEVFRLGFYIPWYKFKLKNLKISDLSNKNVFEYFLMVDIDKKFEELAFKIQNYDLNGFGDCDLLFSWQDNFMEKRDFISSISCSLRSGLHLPTGKYVNSEDTLLKIPFGYDSLWGIPFGGSIEIDIGKYFDIGLSIDCISLFGDIRERYIKTDLRQTELLFTTKSYSFVNPGFKQKYTLYLGAHNKEKVFSLMIAYQYNKQNESDITVCSDEHSSIIAGTMQRLDSWTTHHVVFNLEWRPEFKNTDFLFSFFTKIGFNGERALVADVIGFSSIVSF